MAHRNQPQQIADRSSARAATQPAAQKSRRISTPLLLQRVYADPSSLTAIDVKHLQRTVGNRATIGLLARSTGLQAKFRLGPAGDQYEQEADRVAQQVVRQVDDPQSVQRQSLEEEELQMKPLARNGSALQRKNESRPKMVFAKSSKEMSRQPKPATTIRRVQRTPNPQFTKGMFVQRQEEEEELQMKPLHGPEGGDVEQSVERQIQTARGGGRPMDDHVRSSMEQGFGADFSGVRVHTGGQADALNRSLNAKAFTVGNDVFFGKGQYNPDSSGGRQLLAHELTHTVQQGAAGVQRQLGPTHNANAEGTVQRLFRIDAGSDDYPQKKKKRAFKKDKNVPNDTNFFVSQFEQDGSSYDPNSEELQANLAYKSNADLLVADNLDLAIEAGVEAKYFFARKARVDEANDNLNGNVRLKTNSRYLKINGENGAIKLFQVEPYVPKKKQQGVGKAGSGLDMRIPQRCNEMSEFVTAKAGVEFGAGKQVYGILAQILTQLGERDFEDEWREVLHDIGSVAGNKAYADLTEEMSQAYKDALADDGGEERINELLDEIGVNQFMDPVIGSSITTYGVGTDAENAVRDRENTFGYHFGAVVARSNRDFVTLENYARRDERSSGTLSAGDPLFFFRMYGLDTPTETWHQKALDTGAFVGRAISFVVE
jgi:hypothetical protein